MVNITVNRKLHFDPQRRIVVEIMEIELSDPMGLACPLVYSDITPWPVEMFIEMEANRPAPPDTRTDSYGGRLAHLYAPPMPQEALVELMSHAGIQPKTGLPDQNWEMN